MAMLHYLRTHPFSTMALCNIVGDLCYVGFAFDSEHAVSLPKLAGALFTIVAHTILLAYGDDQARHIAGEKGLLSGIVLRLRGRAQRLLVGLPDGLRKWARVKPIGVRFSSALTSPMVRAFAWSAARWVSQRAFGSPRRNAS